MACPCCYHERYEEQQVWSQKELEKETRSGGRKNPGALYLAPSTMIPRRRSSMAEHEVVYSIWTNKPREQGLSVVASAYIVEKGHRRKILVGW